jgi:hypothetical protein
MFRGGYITGIVAAGDFFNLDYVSAEVSKQHGRGGSS